MGCVRGTMRTCAANLRSCCGRTGNAAGGRVDLVLIIPSPSPKSLLRFSTDLGFALGDVVDSRGPEEEVALLPRLLAVLLQPQGAFDLRHGHRAAAETLLMLEAEEETAHYSLRNNSDSQLQVSVRMHVSPRAKPLYSCPPFPTSPSSPANSSGGD